MILQRIAAEIERVSIENARWTDSGAAGGQPQKENGAVEDRDRRLGISWASQPTRLYSACCYGWHWPQICSEGLETRSRRCRPDRTMCAALMAAPVLLHRT